VKLVSHGLGIGYYYLDFSLMNAGILYILVIKTKELQIMMVWLEKLLSKQTTFLNVLNKINQKRCILWSSCNQYFNNNLYENMLHIFNKYSP
jgi:hypothetical protein